MTFLRRAILMIWLTALPALAVEGKWTPQQVLELPPAWLKSQGLSVPPARLWDAKRGTGLLAGAVNVGGCSGSFISGTGLVITNHHCVFSIIQEHSTPARDLITDGFLAKTRAEELPGKGARIQVPRRFMDVTREVLAAVPAGADDLARFRAIERKQKELVASCEARPATRCQVATFDGGLQYTLVDAVELADVRLVYAPPRAVGEFGGETDNWMWPRHTGDFSIVRAYAAPDGSAAPYDVKNVPHRAEFFFPLATQGVSPGDFVMVLGYPGLTFRALLEAEMAERQKRFYPRVIDAYGEFIRIMEEEGARSPAGKIALASDLKMLHNRRKNAEGQLEGLARGKLLEKQRTAEAAVVAWAQGRPDQVQGMTARTALLEELSARESTWEREFLLTTLRAGAKAIALPVTLARLAQERGKPDLERDPAYMERELPRLRDQVEREQKNFFPAADRRLFLAFLRRAQALGPAERILAVDRHFGLKREGLEAKVDAAYRGSRVLHLKDRLQMFTETPAQLAARRDPLLAFALDLAGEVEALRDVQDQRAGASARLRPLWRRAVLAHAGKPVAPDANGTLRVTFAHVQGYSPRDGVYYTPQTSLRGLVAKHTGKEPFDAPAKVLGKTPVTAGRWRDAKLGDVPVDFLADADTTGGNSGSPTVNGRGELVGVNFDRVWENVANDFGYNPDVARNVNVDVRYVLWLLDQVEDADALLRELGVRKGG